MDLNFLAEFKHKHLLVAGEVGIDEYLWGDTRRISPEAPVPVVEVESQSSRLGLAGNVAQNIASLGARVSLVSVHGEDVEGEKLEAMAREAGVCDALWLTDRTRPTLRKVRVISGRQHVVRVDYERVHPLDASLAENYINGIRERIASVDGIIVQDYGKGLWNADTIAFVREARKRGVPVYVDPSRTSALRLYRDVTLLTPNIVEAEILCGMPPALTREQAKSKKRLHQLATKILEVTSADHAVITCGEAGMVALSHGESGLRHIPTYAKDVYDVTGAGDTVVAVMALMGALGSPLDRAMRVANAAAGIVVGKIGTASVTVSELQAALEELDRTAPLAGMA